MKPHTEPSLQYTRPFTISSKAEFLEAFHWKDQHLIHIPDKLQFPLAVDYYYSWIEPSGNYAFLVLKKPNWDIPKGLVFRRNTGNPTTSNLCDWCHSYGSSDDITMLTVKVDSKVTIGQYLCSKLDCIEKLETQMGSSGKRFEKLAEELCEKIGRFFERAVFEQKEPQ